MGISNMGQMNSGWGICGFTELPLRTLREIAHAATEVGAGRIVSPTMVLAEIKSYLRMLQADEKTGLLSEIESFTKSFGGIHASFTIDSYIERINQVVKTGADAKDAKYSIAMPPQAVTDYLQRMCEFRNARSGWARRARGAVHSRRA